MSRRSRLFFRRRVARQVLSGGKADGASATGTCCSDWHMLVHIIGAIKTRSPPSPNERLIQVNILATPKFRLNCASEGGCVESPHGGCGLGSQLAWLLIPCVLVCVCSLLHSGNSNCPYHMRPHGGAVSQRSRQSPIKVPDLRFAR